MIRSDTTPRSSVVGDGEIRTDGGVDVLVVENRRVVCDNAATSGDRDLLKLI